MTWKVPNSPTRSVGLEPGSVDPAIVVARRHDLESTAANPPYQLPPELAQAPRSLQIEPPDEHPAEVCHMRDAVALSGQVRDECDREQNPSQRLRLDRKDQHEKK